MINVHIIEMIRWVTPRYQYACVVAIPTPGEIGAAVYVIVSQTKTIKI